QLTSLVSIFWVTFTMVQSRFVRCLRSLFFNQLKRALAGPSALYTGPSALIDVPTLFRAHFGFGRVRIPLLFFPVRPQRQRKNVPSDRRWVPTTTAYNSPCFCHKAS
ncbi:unnamed protein product, partial [Laminaria digitata]